jgi:predicted TIM-barrel fold metal-dependent hydrolase
MEIKYGLISADSHAAFDRHDFTSRMSATRWGDRIPQMVEVEHEGRHVHRWTIYGRPPRVSDGGGVCNCPALMGAPFPHFPQRWEEVPRAAYDPGDRLEALDTDGVDAEVLFQRDPGAFEVGDAEFELDVVRAANDAMTEWSRASDRYLPLVMVPYLSGVQVMAREIERAVVKGGHRGVHLNGQMDKSLSHLTDHYWDPIWDVCQELGVPVNFHGSAGVDAGVGKRDARWSGYTARQGHSAAVTTSCVTPAQIISQLIFSGLTERFPDLKIVLAEAGIGGLTHAVAICDHEWEVRHLWTEGIATRPSETVARQMYANFWFEAAAVQLGDQVGTDNIMWESDLPHIPCNYPQSWDAVERVLEGVPSDDRRKLLYENALRVYRIEATLPLVKNGQAHRLAAPAHLLRHVDQKGRTIRSQTD